MRRWQQLKARERARYQTKIERIDRERGLPRQGLSPIGLVFVIAVGIVLGGWLLNAVLSAA